MGRDLRSKDSVVKIDSLLLNKVEKFIKKEKNRLKFVNKKQLVDLAVYDYLKKVEKTKK
jgi:hypothetical protein